MKTDRLEDFIKVNREGFDQLAPSAKVWQNISGTKNNPKVVRINTYLVRAAAVIAVAAITSAILWQTNFLGTGGFTSNRTAPELQELIEAESFYARQVDSKLKEIRKCYYTSPELKEEVETDLNELADMYKILKTDLRENISNKTVIEAMIENNRYRLKLVDDVLEQINC